MASASNPQESTVEPHAALSTHLPGPKLWRCTLCNREMQSVSKADHLAGKAHARELKLSHASSTVVSGTTVVHKTPSKKRQTANNTKNPQQKSWTCPSCHAVVSLKQKASHPCSFIPKSSTAGIDGPLDNFFHSYPSFHYNASTPPSTSFNSLRTHLTKRHRWPPKCREHDELWEQYQDALTEEFNLLFGVQNDLDAWHSLCRAVRIDPLPTTCKDCRSVRTLQFPIQNKYPRH